MITKEKLLELFTYKDGELYWKCIPNNRVDLLNKKAGTHHGKGYTKTCINYQDYYNHRLIFMMHYGYIPAHIDHIDGNPANNRVENLREATMAENQHNRGIQKNNSSGVKGVSWHKHSKKWAVQMRINNQYKHLGYFKDIELAELVSIEARNKFHKEFACHV